MNRGALILTIVILLAGLAWVTSDAWLERDGLSSMKRLVRSRFPGVRQLSTTELAAWLSDSNRPSPLLLDVREVPEFAVSHLPGARNVAPSATAAEAMPATEKERAVVVYCSVGYRSSDMANRLQSAGFTNVLNLEGSIFQWANEGRLLQSNGIATQRVHPYNAKFGQLLKPELRAKH